MLCTMERIDWMCISHQELDMIILTHFEHEQVNMVLSNSMTPLCLACKFNREDLVTVLLHHGAEVNKPSCLYNQQPLHFACKHCNGNLGIVRKLLEAGAMVNTLDEKGITGLNLASAWNNVQVVKLLTGSGADVDIEDEDGVTPLIRACLANSMELVDILLESGSDPNACNGRPVELAVMYPSVELLKRVIEAGANINLKEYLSLACEHNNIEIMKVLNHYDIDVNRCNVLGMTALHTACFSYNASLTCVHLLLQWGANTNAISSMGDTALCYAIVAQNLGKVRLLLAYGADVTTCSEHFWSSMLSGFQKNISEKCIQIFSLLLAAGIRLSFENLCNFKVFLTLLRNSPAKIKLFSLLDMHTSQPLSLQSLCRIGIRSCMKTNIDINMRTLPLPSHIVQFLNFHDIVEEPVF